MLKICSIPNNTLITYYCYCYYYYYYYYYYLCLTSIVQQLRSAFCRGDMQLAGCWEEVRPLYGSALLVSSCVYSELFDAHD